MTPDISERAFEAAIEAALLRHGPDAPGSSPKAVRESPPPYGDDAAPGGYHRRRSEDYDRALCLIPADVVDFLQATQPDEWKKLGQHHGGMLWRVRRCFARMIPFVVSQVAAGTASCRFQRPGNRG